jgi:hypothetical protein
LTRLAIVRCRVGSFDGEVDFDVQVEVVEVFVDEGRKMTGELQIQG